MTAIPEGEIDDLPQQLIGRALFLERRGDVKTSGLLRQAAEEIARHRAAPVPPSREGEAVAWNDAREACAKAAEDHTNEPGDVWTQSAAGLIKLGQTEAKHSIAAAIRALPSPSPPSPVTSEVVEALREIIRRENKSWMPVQAFRSDDEVALDDVRHEVWIEAANIARSALASLEKQP